MADHSDLQPQFPRAFRPYEAYRLVTTEDPTTIYPVGAFRPIYSTPIDDALAPEARFSGPDRCEADYLRNGHPYVDRLLIATYQLMGVDEFTCKTSARARAAWKRRYPRV